MTDPFMPEDPRIGRQRVLALYLRISLAVAVILALATIVAPASMRDDLGAATVVVLVVAPVGRVLWLLVRWTRRGDRRFALAAGILLCVIGLALAIAH